MIEWLEAHMLACSMKATFGIECPGCGMQRAFIALLRGDFMDSLHYNAALVPFLLTISALFGQLWAKHPKGGYVVMWLFILTSTITTVQFLYKVST
jgi:hypothetical protein